MSYYTAPKPGQGPHPQQQQQYQYQNAQSYVPPPNQQFIIPPPPPPKTAFGSKVAQNVVPPLAGFGMGMFVGGSVVLLHFAMNGRGQLFSKQARTAALQSGAAFGTIFAVGTLFRPH